MWAGDDDDVLDADLPIAHTNLIAERDLLVRLIKHPEELPSAQAKLAPWGAVALYRDVERVVYTSIERLTAAGADVVKDCVVDVHAVIYDLQEHGEIADIGALAVHGLGAAEWCPPHKAEHYAHLVAEAYRKRRALEDATALHVHLTQRIAHGDPIGALAYARDVSAATLDDIQQVATTGRFAEDDWSELWTVEPTEPLVEGLYVMDSNAVIWATWGLGKTVIEMDLGLHLALGREWHGHAVTGGHVWYVFAEGRAFIAERLKALCTRYGLERVPPTLHTISLDIPNLLKVGEAEALARRIRAQTSAGERIVCVFLDTVSGTSAGNKEDNTDMARYAANMTAIRTALPEDRPHVRGVHHPGWAGEHSRGGSALPGAIDTEVKVLEGPGGLCVVHCVKQRGGGSKFASFGYKVVPQVIDEAGHTGPVVEWVTLPSEFVADAQAGKLTPKVEQAYRIFQSILQRFDYRAEAGVFPNTWREACEEQGIDARGYRYARDELLKRGLIVQPDTTTAFFPVRENGEEEPEP
jgi:AAA domain